MNSFNVLRYPISIPPKREELEALPPELYSNWLGKSEWELFTRDARDAETITPDYVASWYKNNHNYGYCVGDDYNDLKLLRQMVAEWDV